MTNTPDPTSTGGRYEDMYFVNDKTGYIINFFGHMYKTTDGAVSWTNIYSSEGVMFRSIGFFDANTGLLGTLTDAEPLQRTTNGGTNWQKVSVFSGLPEPKGICGISVVNSNTAYAVGRYYCPAYFVKTTNKGANWTAMQIDTSLARSLIDCYFWSADSGIVVGGYSSNNVYENSNSVVLSDY